MPVLDTVRRSVPGDAGWSRHWLGGGGLDHGRHLGRWWLLERLCTGEDFAQFGIGSFIFNP